MEDVFEDIGYRRPTMEQQGEHVYRIGKGKVEKVKIEYRGGYMAGHSVFVRRDIAEDLIASGKAVEVR